MTFIPRGDKTEKSKLQLYLPPDDYIFIYNYAMSKGKKNLSQAISSILVEYKRFRAIALKLQQQIDIEFKKKDTIDEERVIDKVHGTGTKLDKDKNK